MNREENRLQGASAAEWAWARARVGVAVAILRARPVGMSGRAFAEALGARLRSQDEGWRRKVEELQQEVLRLRQEKLVAAVTADGGITTVDASQDLFGPDSSTSRAEPQPDDDSETPDLLLQDPDPAPPPPPPPPPSSRHGDALSPHVHFLQSLCSLHHGGGGGLEVLWFSPDGDLGSVLGDTVLQLLDSVVGACRDPPALGPPDLVLKACRTAAQTMELLDSRGQRSEGFLRRVEEVLKELTGMLLLRSHHNRAAETLKVCLATLGSSSSSVSKSFLTRHILSEINALAQQLWQSFQEPSGLDQFPVDRYQNSFHLFWVLEELLQKPKETTVAVASCRAEVDFLGFLEQRVFALSEEFPLFSVCMWRIGGLLRRRGGR
ncbi:meiosis-specific protein MEI4 [Mugil cephalus]|uniref:meiosis-specific protein MEI4 n=1 Tax=Mugil cephalus TaxID=48193 RepID=UPI001FB83933|nr:meiosis-specific protein MEI4 [Mugil cephalus]